MPLGMLGFERCKSFSLHADPVEEPFLWLEAVGTKLAFLAISPFVVLPSYSPEISDEDVKFLGLESPKDALIFNIVTVRGPQQATLNLKGPIVLNKKTLVAKQIIPVNAPDFSVVHPLSVKAG
jgi:flagellar assembly factor FliW